MLIHFTANSSKYMCICKIDWHLTFCKPELQRHRATSTARFQAFSFYFSIQKLNSRVVVRICFPKFVLKYLKFEVTFFWKKIKLKKSLLHHFIHKKRTSDRLHIGARSQKRKPYFSVDFSKWKNVKFFVNFQACNLLHWAGTELNGFCIFFPLISFFYKKNKKSIKIDSNVFCLPAECLNSYGIKWRKLQVQPLKFWLTKVFIKCQLMLHEHLNFEQIAVKSIKLVYKL